MTKTRVISALVMGAVVIFALFFLNLTAFSVAALAIMLLALYEWSKLCGCELRGYLQTALLLGLLAAAYYLWDAFEPMIVLLVGAVFWLVKAVALRLPPKLNGHPCVFEALISLFAAWVALITLKAYPGTEGVLLLLALLMVWSADSFAYFGGRKWGRVKLAPSISPGKTSEGVLAGMLGTVVVGLLYALVFLPETRSLSGVMGVVMVALLVSIFSVLGDLNESKLKRAAGVKDSGTLIPGHGGVMDRIDGLLPAVVVFTLAWWWLTRMGWFA